LSSLVQGEEIQVADWIRRRVTFANVISLIALFVALGGTVYATGVINGKAVKKGSLPGNRLRPDSISGKQVNEAGLALPAFSKAYASSTKGPIILPGEFGGWGGGTETLPELFQLEPGSYVVIAKVRVIQTQASATHVNCNINSRLDDDYNRVSLGPAGSGSDEASISLQYTHSTPTGASVIWRCWTDGVWDSVEARDAKLTAIKVAGLSVQQRS
jgi:hypothetical protein